MSGHTNTGQIALNHRHGILTVDAPKAQAAAGFLRQASPIELRDVQLRVRNDYIAIHVVSLDGEDLSKSGHILIQAGTTARPYGFADKAATAKSGDKVLEGREITELGSFPWNLDENDFDLVIRNGVVSTAYVLDANGHAVEELPLQQQDGVRTLTFPRQAIHVILR